MITSAVIHILAAFLGLIIATRFVPGTILLAGWTGLLPISIILGLADSFIKPAIKAITLPIRIITLGIFTIAVNMLLVWVIGDILFPDNLEIKGVIALFWTTLCIWLVNRFLFQLYDSYKKNNKN